MEELQVIIRESNGLCHPGTAYRDGGDMFTRAGTLESTGERTTVAGWAGIPVPTPAEVYRVPGTAWEVIIPTVG